MNWTGRCRHPASACDKLARRVGHASSEASRSHPTTKRIAEFADSEWGRQIAESGALRSSERSGLQTKLTEIREKSAFSPRTQSVLRPSRNRKRRGNRYRVVRICGPGGVTA